MRASTPVHTGGRGSGGQFLEAQVISSSVDGWATHGPVEWIELCFNHPVICCFPSLFLPYYSHLPPLPVLCL